MFGVKNFVEKHPGLAKGVAITAATGAILGGATDVANAQEGPEIPLPQARVLEVGSTDESVQAFVEGLRMGDSVLQSLLDLSAAMPEGEEMKLILQTSKGEIAVTILNGDTVEDIQSQIETQIRSMASQIVQELAGSYASRVNTSNAEASIVNQLMAALGENITQLRGTVLSTTVSAQGYSSDVVVSFSNISILFADDTKIAFTVVYPDGHWTESASSSGSTGGTSGQSGTSGHFDGFNTVTRGDRSPDFQVRDERNVSEATNSGTPVDNASSSSGGITSENGSSSAATSGGSPSGGTTGFSGGESFDNIEAPRRDEIVVPLGERFEVPDVFPGKVFLYTGYEESSGDPRISGFDTVRGIRVPITEEEAEFFEKTASTSEDGTMYIYVELFYEDEDTEETFVEPAPSRPQVPIIEQPSPDNTTPELPRTRQIEEGNRYEFESGTVFMIKGIGAYLKFVGTVLFVSTDGTNWRNARSDQGSLTDVERFAVDAFRANFFMSGSSGTGINSSSKVIFTPK